MAVVTCTSLALSASSVFRNANNSKQDMRNVMPKLKGTLETKPVATATEPEKAKEKQSAHTVADEIPAEVSAEVAEPVEAPEIPVAETPATEGPLAEETPVAEDPAVAEETGDPAPEAVAPAAKPAKKAAKKTAKSSKRK